MNKKNKKLNFTFVYPDFEYSITKENKYIAEKGGWYHEGIAQLASIIEQLGWSVNLIHITSPIKKEKFIKKLKENNPTIVGFSIRTGVKEYAKELISWAKTLNPFIIVGSYHATLWPEEVISWNGVDALCIGEGENAIKDLIKNFDKKEKILNIGSLWIKNSKGVLHRNPVYPLVYDLDSLPLPKFELFDFSKLIASQIKAAVIVLTRGCPFNCTYCWNNFARNLYPNKEKYVRYRNPDNCIKYIQKVINVYPEIRSFRFQDDLWPFHNNWFDNFSKLYIQKIHMPFECHLRANVLNEKIIKRLKNMKCNGVYFGVESGDDYIRNKILKRGMTKKTLLDAFLTCKKYKIRTHAYNIVGLPYENMHRVLNTVKLNAQLKPTDMFFPVYFPYAGSELYDIAIKSGYFDPNKGLDPYVNIEMPDFKRDRIRFASLYAKTFVRLYQLAFSLPEFLKTVLERIFDTLWLFPYWPFKMLNGWIVFKRKFIERIKTLIKTHFFWFYLLLKK